MLEHIHLAGRPYSGTGDPAGVAGTGEPVGVAVIGMGYWGPNLLRVLSENPGVEVRWICDLDEDRLTPLHRRYPGTRMTSQLDRALSDPAVDGVIIATPVHTHYELARRSLQAGKHTFVEKPLASSTEEADDLARLAAERELTLMCGHTFLYSPAVRAVKAMIDEGKLGDIYFASSSRVNLGLHQRDVSVIWDLGPHDFSILLYWLDELPVSVHVMGRDSIVPGIADVAFVSLTFASGIIANVELSWLAPSKLRRTVLVGSQRMVIYEDGAGEPVRLFDRGVVYEDPASFGEYHLSYRTGDILSPRLEPVEPLAAEAADFVGAIRNGQRKESELDLARTVVRLLEASEQSLKSGGREVEIDHSGVSERIPVQRHLAVA